MGFPVFEVLAGFWSVMAASSYPAIRSDGLGRAVVKASAVAALAGISAVHGPGWLTFALALSAFGDFALNRPGERWFLVGMAAFGAAHLGFMALFLSLGAFGEASWIWLRVGLGLVLASVALMLGRRYAAQAGALRVPVMVYVGLIACMGFAALALPLSIASLILLAGALLFILSDALIGQQRFLERVWRGQDLAIWVSYYAAQVLLSLGALAA